MALMGGAVDHPAPLAAAPRCTRPPPQDSKYCQKRPPEGVRGLIRHDCENDADDDANQCDKVAHAYSHFSFP